jgi:hypothetical protein
MGRTAFSRFFYPNAINVNLLSTVRISRLRRFLILGWFPITNFRVPDLGLGNGIRMI